MALTSIFVEKKPTGPKFTVNKTSQSFLVDASISESYAHDAEITDNPVEKGLDVSDNVNVRPVEITLNMLVTETPINDRLQNLANAAAVTIGSKVGGALSGALGSVAGGVIGGSLAALTSQVSPSKSRVQTNYQNFVNMLNQKNVLTVQTGLDLYPRMLIKNIRVNRDQRTGQALSFSVTLREIRIVSSQTVDLPEIDSDAIAAGISPLADLGRQSAKQTSTAQQSILAGIVDSVF